jgi:metal-responsive CopG/Arc/MetJ family transcriptional regulator
MKTAISVPDTIFTRADRLAKRLHMSRSELYARAVEEYIGEHRHSRVREKLDEIYSAESAAIDPAILNAQAASLPEEDW